MTLHSKADFQNLMQKLLAPLKPLYSENSARLSLGKTAAHYDRVAAEMEAFSRPLWALAPYWQGGGIDDDFAKLYLSGFINGTDPENAEYWGEPKAYDQRFVEMAAIATALMLAPDLLWTPLSEKQKLNLENWLLKINSYEIPQVNWIFFRVLVNSAFKLLGRNYSQNALDESFIKIDSWYKNSGWYVDGESGQQDYYIGFAMHFYGLLYARVMGDTDLARSETYKKRAAEFAGEFIYWFDDNGAGLPYGRSLTYRFAQVSFWSACIYAEIEPFPIAVMKGIITRNINYFLNSEIFDRDGILTIGYTYPNFIMSENYNAPGSPYWAMKSFLILALPDSHKFWEVQSAPMPEFSCLKLLHNDMLIQRGKGTVTAFPSGFFRQPGHGRMAEKYAKFAYSTKWGFSAARSNSYLDEAAPDSMLAFVIDGDSIVFTKKMYTSYKVYEDKIYIEWNAFLGISIKTTIIPNETGHIRTHEIESEYGCYAYDCGFALPRYYSGLSETRTSSSVKLSTDFGDCAVYAEENPNAEPFVLYPHPDTSLIFTNTVIPCIKYRITKGKTHITTRFDY